MARYVLSTIATFENLVHIIPVIILSQKQHRSNSCSIYLLATSIFGLIITNWTIMSLVYSLDHTDLVSISLTLCCIRSYITHTSSMCFRYIVVVAYADHYSICSEQASIKNYCRISIHLLLLFDGTEYDRCGTDELYGKIYSIYSLICFGLIHTCLMFIFDNLLTIKLQRQTRSHIQSTHTSSHTKRDEFCLGKVILAEIIVSIFCRLQFIC